MRPSAAVASEKPWREVTEPAPEKPDEGGGGGGEPPAGAPPADGDDRTRFGAVVPLGTGEARGRKTYVFLDGDGDRQAFTARDLHQQANLVGLFGGSRAEQWLRRTWPLYVVGRKGEVHAVDDFDARALAGALIGACGALGRAEHIRLRRDGVWRHGEGVLFHAGDAIIADDAVHDPGFRDGAAVYVSCQRRARPAAKAATAAEARRLAEAIGLWQFDAEVADVAGQVLLGLIGCAMLSAVLPWRPHVFLLGGLGAGKSSLARLIAAACGADEPSEDLTPAFLQRMHTDRSNLIALDEREPDAPAVGEIVRIMRGSSDGVGNRRGQMDPDAGGTIEFRVAGCFLLAATTTPPMSPADASRISVIELREATKKPREVIDAAIAEAGALHPALLRRMMRDHRRYLDNFAVARDAAAQLDATSRSADQVGSLVAGWWTLCEDAPLTPRVAAAEMARFGPFLTTSAEAREGGAGRAVLQHLMGSRVALRARSSDQVTVQAAVEDAARLQNRLRFAAPDGPVNSETMAEVVEHRRLLGGVGLALNAFGFSGYGWPWPFDGEPEPGLLIACELPSPGHLFAGTPWKGSGWRDQLKQLAGVRISRRVMKFPKAGPSRAVFVPFGLLAIGADEMAGSG